MIGESTSGDEMNDEHAKRKSTPNDGKPYDRDYHDPDCRSLPDVDGQMGRGAMRWHNLAGGCGFHGDRVVAMRNVGERAAGRILDSLTHNEFPKVKT